MSAISLTIKALRANSGVTDIVGQSVKPYPLPLKATLPALAVAMSAEEDPYTLGGAGQFPESIVQIHCVAAKAGDAIDLGEAVKDALQDLHYTTGGADAWFAKEPVDFTDFADDQSSFRRVLNFAVRWR